MSGSNWPAVPVAPSVKNQAVVASTLISLVSPAIALLAMVAEAKV